MTGVQTCALPISIKVTGLTILDPLIAMAVALLIIKAALELIGDSMCSILDVHLPEPEERVIREVLKEHSTRFVEFHQLRTRKAGSHRYVDLHLVVPKNWAINEVHALCDRIEEDICSRFKNTHVLIHTEPCGLHCEDCNQVADEQKKAAKCEPACGDCTQCGKEPGKG